MDVELLAVTAMNVPEFVQNVKVVTTLDDGAVSLPVKQSASGQELGLRAVETNPNGPSNAGKGSLTANDFSNLYMASACCANFVTHFGAALMVPQTSLNKMEEDFVRVGKLPRLVHTVHKVHRGGLRQAYLHECSHQANGDEVLLRSSGADAAATAI